MKTLFQSINEPFNTISHALGALLGIVGFVVLLSWAETSIQIVAMVLYGVPLILLYSASSLYHGLPVPSTIQQLFGRLDKASIYLLIAGSTTPPALLTLQGWTSWSMFGLLWSFALVGIILSAIDPFEGRWSATVVYLTMGWISLIFLQPLIAAFSIAALFWCVAGGVLYTAGAIIYALDRPVLVPGYVEAHELWHLFVLMGSLAHFVFIAGYTL